MELSPKTKIDDLLTTYPFLMDYFINRSAKFKLLQNTVMRKTVGKMATLAQVASIGEIQLEKLLSEIAEEIKAKTGQETTVIKDADAWVEPIMEPKSRIEVLKDIIKDLHQGVEMSILKKRFHDLIKDIDATEIAKMEQKLMEEGMPEAEVKRLCDVHVEVFKEALEHKEPPAPPPGHPIHTLMKENRASEEIIKEIYGILGTLKDSADKEAFIAYQKVLRDLTEKLSYIDLHYLKKENQLFPVLEQHGIKGPSEVMWAIHDDIRQTIKYAKSQIAESLVPVVYGTLRFLLKTIEDMVYKEEHILFPMAMEILTDNDWLKVSLGEEDIGYAWITPDKGWEPKVEAAAPEEKVAGLFKFDTGKMTIEQANLMMTHLPIDVSFVNENDEVIYYSQTKDRIFPRSPGVIGRKVQNCHPPKSYHVVQRILDEFRAGTKDAADFWIQMRGKFIHIRYFAVRDKDGAYKGTLEVSQDVTAIRKLEGEQRLLNWE